MGKWRKIGSEETIEQVFLRNIGVKSLDDVNAWFKKSYQDDYRVDRIDEAVDLAMRFRDQSVTIVGDYDGDGVTSTSILASALQWAGFKDVRYRIPKRFSEGFGINPVIIDEIPAGLIITCDNGVAQLDAIQRAKDKGLTVIIIDHHEPVVSDDGTPVLPPADIIIDPNAIPGSADFNGYCGAGLCYKFAKALLRGREDLLRRLLTFAAIGTVTDVMELKEENYVFVRNGLKYLRQGQICTTGLYALICEFELNRHITAKDIGFKIGPALNAASRMKDDGAKDAVELLTFNGPYEHAIPLAQALIARNEARKEAKNEGMKKARDIMASECRFGEAPLVLYIPDIQEGVIGILAGQLAEKYKVPAIVFSDTENGTILKGSGRSYGDYDMKAALDQVQSLLIQYGGHPGACGCSISKTNLDAFRSALMNNIGDFTIDSKEDVFYDLEIQASQIPAVIQELDRYEPYGEGNPAPIFYIKGFPITPTYGQYKKLLGQDQNIVKLQSNNAVALGFDMAKPMEEIDKPMNLDLIGTLSDGYFRGNVSHQVEFTAFSENQVNTIETPLAAKLRMMASKMASK